MKLLAEIQSIDHNLKAVEDAVKAIRELDVCVGIPQEKSSREGEISNAELLYVHSKGSPLKGIPARPIIEPAIEDSKEQIGEMLRKTMQKALDGDKQGAIDSLKKTGMQGENIVHAWFDNPKNKWKALSDKTIQARKRKMSKQSLKKAESMIAAAEGDTSSAFRPLVDTGRLKRSIIYVVRKK